MLRRNELESFYENQGPEDVRLREGSPQRVEFLTATHFLEKYLAPNASILDNCAGSGVYAFHFAEKGHRVTAGDVVPYNVELMRAKQAEAPVLKEIYLGDAIDQSRFPDGVFDAVLCMGALYHLDDAGERKRSVEESLRVLRNNGLIACSYMNRYAVILNNITPNLGNLDEIQSFLEEGKEGVFYASTPEESEGMLVECGVEVLCHVTMDGMSTFLYHTSGLIDAEGFERWQQYHKAVCDVPSLLGYGYHNLIIGRKQQEKQR